MKQMDDVTASADAWELSAQVRLLIGRLNRTLREKAGFNQLGLSQTSVLIRLEREGPNTVTELARAEGMRPQSMGAVIAELGAAGLICGAPDPTDGRRTIISLTDAGWDAIRLSRAERQDWLAHMIGAKFSPAEIRQLVTTMELLERLI
jgi:DNA-binding MarR family transcriptional regulator